MRITCSNWMSASDKAARKTAIHWTDFLPDDQIAAWLNAVDLVALPFSDGASYSRSSLIAAIHQGCAILTTEPSIEIDAFQHCQNLWLVERSSAESIQGALAHLLADREQLDSLRAGALELSQRFDWDRIAQKTQCSLYQSCL